MWSNARIGHNSGESEDTHSISKRHALLSINDHIQRDNERVRGRGFRQIPLVTHIEGPNESGIYSADFGEQTTVFFAIEDNTKVKIIQVLFG